MNCVLPSSENKALVLCCSEKEEFAYKHGVKKELQGFDFLVIIVFGEGDSNPLQYSCLESPMDRGAWQAIVHGVAKSWT